MYQPKFTMTSRRGQKALWVKMPSGDEFNIYDLENEDIEKESIRTAIIHAFELGWKAAYENVDAQKLLPYQMDAIFHQED